MTAQAAANFLTIVERLWNDEVAQRRFAFAAERQRILENGIRRGIAGSPLLNGTLADSAAAELRLRGLMAIAVLRRVLGETEQPLDATTYRDISEALNRFLTGQANELAQAPSHGGTVSPDRPRLEFARLGLHEIENRVFTELDLLFLRATRQSAGQAPASVTVHAHSIGAVQTGAASTANVTLAPSASDRAELMAALQAMSDAIARISDGVLPVRREELTAVVLNIRNEADRDHPSGLVLSTLASGLATTVQTTAALLPAYLLVKAALAHFGVVLPF